MELINNYLPKTEFSSYEDFKENFKINVPEDFDFARDIVDQWALIDPNKRALVYCDDNNFSRTYTFKDISSLSKKAAMYFYNLGLRKGDRVFTLLRRRAEYWICAVALHRLGVTVIPGAVQLMKKDIAYRINCSKAKMILAIDDPFVLKQISGIEEECNSLQKIVAISDRPQNIAYDFNREYINCEEYQGYSGLKNEDEMIIYFTSGTTGYPKMAIHNRTYPLGHILTARYMQRVQNNGLHLTQADSGWAKFGWGNIYGQWICGSAILGYDPVRFDGHRLMNIMEKYAPTSLCIPPTMYRILLSEGVLEKHLKSVQWFSTAGEPLSGEVNKEFFYLSGKYIHEGYGQSESTPLMASFEWLGIKPSSMGKPSPLYDIKLIKSNGEICQKKEPGEVVIIVNNQHPLGLLAAYALNDKIINPYENGIYHTGDIAYEDEEGFYWYVGRNDDIIKCSAYRIGPFEIESVLNTHSAVKESAVIGFPDAIRGKIVCAVITLNEGCYESEELTKELQNYVKQNTAPYKYPRKIFYVSSIPKTNSGKIMRKELSERIINMEQNA